jgi:hypothetical protein
MESKGKQLERLVALIEKLYLPEGFEITTNERVYDDGVQIAEFDIEIRGRLGTTELRWLIECWIGRRRVLHPILGSNNW